MLAIKSPTAWGQLLRMLAEQVANEVLQQAPELSGDDETEKALYIQHHESSDLRTL